VTTQLERLRERAEAIREEFERARTGLFGSDREPKLGPTAHRERLAALERERDEQLDQLMGELRDAVEEARRVVSGFEDGDPASLIDPEELAAAAARKPFAEDDVWALDEEGLEAKLRAVLAGGNRSSIFAYWRAALARHDSLGSPRDLEPVLGEMRNALAGADRLAEVEQARATVEEAVSVELLLGNLRRGATSAGGAWLNRRFGAA
jgi:hypothetical protein